MGGTAYRLFYFDTLIDYPLVQDFILKPLLLRPQDAIRDVVSILDYAETEQLEDAVQALMYGKAVLHRGGDSKLYLLGVDLKKERPINIPFNERVFTRCERSVH